MKKALLAVAGASAVAAGSFASHMSGKPRSGLRLPHRYSNNNYGELPTRNWRTRKFYALVDEISLSATNLAMKFGQGEHFKIVVARVSGYHPSWVANALAEIESSKWVFCRFVEYPTINDGNVPIDVYVFRRVNM